MTLITAKTKVTAVTGKIIPLADDTRVRYEPTTYSTTRPSAKRGAQVEIDQVVEYLENDLALPHVVKGDKWGRVIKINGILQPQPSFMAIYYHGLGKICTEQYTANGGDSGSGGGGGETTIVYPDMVLVGPAGAQREYVPKVP